MNPNCFSVPPRIICNLKKLLNLRYSWPGEIFHWDQGMVQVRECIVRRNLLRGQGNQVIYSLLYQEPNLE